MRLPLAHFRAALERYDANASSAVDDKLLDEIVSDTREEFPAANDTAITDIVCTTAVNVAHEMILGD
jgi:hypothetical protein